MFSKLGDETRVSKLGVDTKPLTLIFAEGKFVRSEPSPIKKLALTVEAFKPLVLISWLTVRVDALISWVP